MKKDTHATHDTAGNEYGKLKRFERPEYTISEGSYHPAADDAMNWLKMFMVMKPLEYLKIKEAIYSTALSGNEMSNYCIGTIERMAANEPVSDRYLLGLAWTVKSIFEDSESKREED